MRWLDWEVMSTTATTSAGPDAALRYAAEHADRFVDELCELLRIPSISTQDEHLDDCRAAAMRLATELERIGLERVELHETGGPPILYAEWLGAGPGAPTVLLYGHYDVQPPDPLDEWLSDPFDPQEREGNLYARGASDDKGQLYTHVKALESILATDGRLPLNVKLVIEGEEESGSVHLDGFLEEHAAELAADCGLISDTHMPGPDQPSLVASLRGMAYCEVTVSGPTHDLHSGLYGGTVRNPAEELGRLLATLKDADGRVLVEGFYDDVLELDPAERARLAEVPFDEAGFLASSGAKHLHGEAGYSTAERIGTRPTVEVNGIWGGYIDPGAKTVLPARAHAKVSMRLVPHQRPGSTAALLRRHLEHHAPEGIGVEVRELHGGHPCLVDVKHPAMQAASAALAAEFGRAPVFERAGGSIPVVASFAQVLGIAGTVLMGFGLPDDRLHSPNEKITLAQFHRGIAASIRFLHGYAAAPQSQESSSAS